MTVRCGAIAVAALALIASTSASAQTRIPITNPSFEASPPFGTPLGWTVLSGGVGTLSVGLAPNGSQVAYLVGFQTVQSIAYQMLTASLLPSTLYTLWYWVGHRGDDTSQPAVNYFAELQAGTTVLASDPGLSPPPQRGAFAQYSLSYNSPSSGPLIGQPLGIRFGGSVGSLKTFDNFELTVAPEPSVIVLLATGLLAIGAVVRRRVT
jgi:hypothetical protein